MTEQPIARQAEAEQDDAAPGLTARRIVRQLEPTGKAWASSNGATRRLRHSAPVTLPVVALPGLSEAQTVAALALVDGRSIREAAEAAGVVRSTVSRWRRDGAKFRAALERLRHEAWDAKRERLRALTGKALDAVEGVLDDTDTPANVRLAAALVVLRFAGLGDAQVAPEAPRTASEIAEEDRVEAVEAQKDRERRWTLALL